MSRVTRRRLALWLLAFMIQQPASAAGGGLSAPAPMHWMSEQYPPYNFVDEAGAPRGIVVEVLQAVWNRLGDPEAGIEFLPWARAYARLQRDPNTALFSMTYTPERQRLFRFVGPVISTRMVILAPRAAHRRVDGPQALSALKIGVVRDDIGETLLRDLKVAPEAIVYSNRADNLVQLLHRGRVDAIAYSYDVALWNLRKLGIDPGEYESVYTLLEGELGFAFHPQTPQARLARLQGALDAVKASGQAEWIRRKYLGVAVE